MNDDGEGSRSVAELLDEAVGEEITVADTYRVTTISSGTEPPEVKEYVMPPQSLDDFFDRDDVSDEIVVDVRPEEQ